MEEGTIDRAAVYPRRVLEAALKREAAALVFAHNHPTNIHQLYESQEQDWVAANPVDAMLGRLPSKDLSSDQRSMLERVKVLKDLVVINDEAHHVHDEDLAWSQSLLGIHKALPKGLSLWLDFSATPRNQNRIHYSWTICDYPLAQAVEDRIVKAPIIVTKEDDPNQPAEPEEVTKDNVTEKYGYWIHAAVQCWHTHYKIHKKLKRKPVLFIMAEKNSFADAIGKYLGDTPEFRIRPSEVKIIHTDNTGEITKKGLEEARALVRDIDQPSNRIKAIVSVMMLREGWDVRAVTVVLGLRPFTAATRVRLRDATFLKGLQDPTISPRVQKRPLTRSLPSGETRYSLPIVKHYFGSVAT